MRAVAAWRTIIIAFVLVGIAGTARAQGDESGYDHQAHAKPGGPFDLVDWDGDGKESVTFDASASHSHYFHSGPPILNGKIVEYVWTSKATGNVLLRSKNPYMTGTFYVGTTILQLTVEDNTGDKASAWTYVTLRKAAAWEVNPPNPREVSPTSGPTYGGLPVTIRGFGFYHSPVVRFGDSEAKLLSVNSNREIVVEAPPGKEGMEKITVSNGYGDSVASVEFEFFESDIAPVKFEDAHVTDMDGEIYQIPEITAIKIGPDGLYYATSLDGYVHVLNITKEMQVASHCKSARIGKNRAAMGIGFHPSDMSLPPKVFVSTSTLYWKNKKRKGVTWNNGKVEIWQKGSNDEECLGYVDDVVSGLPVSNHDHGVNAMEFLPKGDMLLSIGGTTNAGIHTHDDGIGGIPESPLSSAIVRVLLSKQDDYIGHIEYDQLEDPGTTDVTSGDVEVYASGIRNCFGFTRHTSGKVYALSNGPNSGFGVASKDCETEGGSVSTQDSLLSVEEDGYYGHPNRNRGRNDTRQCSYMTNKNPGEGFKPAMNMFGSSTNGIFEYTANTFDFQLRRNLFLSKMSWSGPGMVHRVVLSEDGEGIEQRSVLWEDGGLSMVMSPYGDIIMPKVKQNKIFVLRAVYTPADAVHVLAVTPARGPASGGFDVLVTGSGFNANMTVTFGDEPCEELSNFAADGASVTCRVPAGTKETRVGVVATVGDNKSKSHEDGEFEYVWG